MGRKNANATTARKRQRARAQQTPKKRGVVPIRRMISPESYGVFDSIRDNLVSEVRGQARLFDIETIGITVIGFSRFDLNHRQRGPRTEDIANRVPSIWEPMTARIGAIGLYGSGNRFKLAFRLNSNQLNKEIISLEDEFDRSNWRLKKDHNTRNNEINPHASVALLYEDLHKDLESNKSAVRRIGHVATHDIPPHSIIKLEPVQFNY